MIVSLYFRGMRLLLTYVRLLPKLLEYGAFGQLENRDKQEVSRRDNTRHVSAMSHWNE